MTTDQMIARLMIALAAEDTAAIDNLLTALEDRLPAEELRELLERLRARLAPPSGGYAGRVISANAA